MPTIISEFSINYEVIDIFGVAHVPWMLRTLIAKASYDSSKE